MPTLRSSALRWTLVSSAVYLTIIWIYFVLPLGAQFGRVMLGTAVFAHDPILNAGILEWGRQAIASPSLQFFDWPAGFGSHNTLAITENLLGWQPEFALLREAGASVTFAYNSLFITSFFFSALGARLLAKRLGASEEGALLSGIIFAFLPFHLVHAIHLQTLAVCWAPFAIYFLDRYLTDGKLINLGGVAAFFLLTFLSGLYIGFFLAIALPAYLLGAVGTHRLTLPLRRLLALIGAGAVVAVALWPVVSHYLLYANTNPYGRSAEMPARSIELLALVKVPPWQAFWLGTHYPGVTTHESAAFPGFVAVILVVAALKTAHDPPSRATKRLLILMALLFFAFSLGPRLSFQWGTPVPLAEWIPLPGRIFDWFSAIRWPMRALLFSLIFIAIIAGLGFTWLTSHASARHRAVDCALVAALLFLEYRPMHLYTADSVVVPDPLALSDAYPLLATENNRGGIVELPITDSEGYRMPMFVLSVYGSAGHLRKVAATNRNILEETAQLPAQSAVTNLRGYGCSRIVIHRKWRPEDSMEKTIAGLRATGLPVLWESEESVVFSLQP